MINMVDRFFYATIIQIRKNITGTVLTHNIRTTQLLINDKERGYIF